MSASKPPLLTALLLFPLAYFCLGVVMQLISALRHPNMSAAYHAGELREVIIFLIFLAPVETAPFLAAVFARWRLVTSMPVVWLAVAAVISAALSVMALDLWKGKGGDANALVDLLSLLFWLAAVPFLVTTLTLFVLGKRVGAAPAAP